MDFSLFIQATLFSALPSFGQTKIVNLSDELAWQLSLRSRDTIGRPLVTAQAEAWSIGGYLAVFLLAVLAFGSWALVWRFMSRCIGAKSIIGAMAAMIIVYAIFSTTLTSQAMSLLRMPLQTTIGLWVAITVFAWFRTSKYKPAWTSI